MIGPGLSLWTQRDRGARGGGDLPAPAAPVMPSDYVVPDMPALPPDLIDGVSDAAPAKGWTLSGGGATNTETGTTSTMTLADGLTLTGATHGLFYDMTAQSDPETVGMRYTLQPDNIKNNYWLSRHFSGNAFPAKAAILRGNTGTQTKVCLQGFSGWTGTVENLRLYDISYTESLPTILLIVAGETNAAGAGEGASDSALDVPHPLIQMISPVNAARFAASQTDITLGQDPLSHQDGAGNYVGPGMSAARRIIAETDGACRVVILPVAKSAAALVGADAPWNPDTTGALKLYDRAMATYAAARAAISSHAGSILLWSHGEADAGYGSLATYPAAFSSFVSRLRTDTGEPSLPVVVMGAVLPDEANPSALIVMQRKLDENSGAPEAVPGVTYFDGPAGTEWVNTSDTVHFTTPAQRIRGDHAGQVAVRALRATGSIV